MSGVRLRTYSTCRGQKRLYHHARGTPAEAVILDASTTRSVADRLGADESRRLDERTGGVGFTFGDDAFSNPPGTEAQSRQPILASGAAVIFEREGIRVQWVSVNDIPGVETPASSFKLWLGTNYKPLIKGTDDAIWDRIKLIPFNIRIADGERSPDLGEKLFAWEAPGTLNWALDGLAEYQRVGLREPNGVTEAVEEYRESQDLFQLFLAECMRRHFRACYRDTLS